MRTVRARPLAAALIGACASLIALAPLRAGESDAASLIRQTTAALARGDHRAIARLVAADRAGIFEAVELLLRGAEPAPEGLVDELARDYRSAFADPFLVERVAMFRSWSPGQRAAREAARKDKEAARLASNAGRQDEALAGYERVLAVFRQLGDRRLEARTLLNQAASLTLKGETREALVVLDRAQAAGRLTGDQVLLAAVGMDRAYALEDLGDFAAERVALDEALGLSRAIGDRVGEATALESLCSLAIHTSDWDRAEGLAHEIARLGDAIPDAGASWAAQINLAAVRAGRGDLVRAAHHLERAAAFARAGGLPVEEAGADYNLSRNARKRGDFAEAGRLLESARRLVAGTDDILRGRVEVAEADLLLEEGRYAETLPFLDAAEARLRGIDVVAVLSELHQARAAALYYLGDYEGAVVWVRRALDQAVTASRKDMEASCRTNLGRLLSTLGNQTAALEELEQGRRLFELTGDARGSATASTAIGAMKWRAGDAGGARAALQRAIDALDRPETSRERAEAMTHLAEIELAPGGSGRAAGFELLRRATAVFLAGDDLRGVSMGGLVEAEAALDGGDLEAARDALDRIARVARGRRDAEFDWEIHYAEGRLAEAGGDSPRAVAAFRRAVDEVESLRSGVRAPSWRAAIQEDRIEPYRALVGALCARGEIRKAYAVARAAKARTFAERISPPAFPSDDVAAPGETPGLRRPARDDPPATPAIATERLQSLLRRDEALVDFFFAGDRLLAFALTRDRLALREIPVPAELGALLEVSRYPGRPDPAEAAVTRAWTAAMDRLGPMLLSPLAEDLSAARHLLIVPNGALHGLPFAALSWRQRPLVEGWSLSILPAAEALLSRRAGPRAPAPPRPRLLALGDPQAAEPAAALPGAAAEAREVKELPGHDGELYVGSGARESIVRRRAGEFDRIHLAAHGRIDRLSPARSYIALAPGDGEDGRLEAGEIADLKLSASLVVLSGCGTGRDAGISRDDPRADDRIGLARAFLAAGAGSVVAGLWEIQDRASTSIMPRLYDHLQDGSAASALAQLQRDLLAGRILDENGRRLDHPFYWAGLVSYGAGGEARPAPAPPVASARAAAPAGSR